MTYGPKTIAFFAAYQSVSEPECERLAKAAYEAIQAGEEPPLADGDKLALQAWLADHCGKRSA